MAADFKIVKAGAVTAPAFLLAGCEGAPPTEMQHLLWFIGHPEIFIPLSIIVFGPIVYLLICKFGRPRGVTGLWICGLIAFFAATLICARIKSRIGAGAFLGENYALQAYWQFAAPLLFVFVLFAAVTATFNRVTGRGYSVLLAKTQFWLWLFGASLMLFPQYIIIRGEPRRYIGYAQGFELINPLNIIGAGLAALSFVVFIGMVVEALVKKRPTPKRGEQQAKVFD